MFFIYGVGLFLWITLLEVGSKKSWEVFNLFETKNVVKLITRVVIVVAAMFMMSVLGVAGDRDYSRVVYFTIVVPFYYGIYILLYSKERDSWKEFLRIDKWNALALFGCVCVAFCSTIIK
jgi:hypothetical protein